MTISRAEAERLLTAPGQPFETAVVDIAGVTTTVWKNCPATLGEVLRGSRRHGDAPFLVYEDERTTFQEHFRAAAHLATQLRDRFHVQNGDRVAIAMRNLPEWSVAFWAATAAGAVAVPLNTWWTGEELHYGLADSAATVLFCDEERAERIAGYITYLPDLRSTIVVRADPRQTPIGMRHYADVLGQIPADVEPPDVGLDTDSDATIFYTAGTTGRPKGALGSHRNICTNPLSLMFVNRRDALQAGAEPGDGAPAPGAAYLLTVPLFHVTGCHSILVTSLLAGGKLVMMHHWDAGRALELIERERVTTVTGAPTMVMQVLDHPDFARRDTSSVRSVGYGGAPAPPELVKRIKALFPDGKASNGYGLTETSSVSTVNSGPDYEAKPDSVGPPVPVVSVQVVDSGGKEVPVGDVGELWIKGPNVVKGYWGQPEATRDTFGNGWFHTGDVARLDEDGFVYIVDRAKDMLIRAGENVYCVEIETVLHEHACVADAAVIGIPHPVLGEEVGAVVQLRPGSSATETDIQEHVASRLAGFKVPVRVWFSDKPLPRNPAGKLLKRQLRDDLIADRP
jgi:long-chain acyl-CoA synthetase